MVACLGGTQEPYTSAEKNKWTSPQLDADVEALHRDCKARAAAARLQVLLRSPLFHLISRVNSALRVGWLCICDGVL